MVAEATLHKSHASEHNSCAVFGRRSHLRRIATDMASKAAYVSSAMFVICAIRQMGGRSEAAVSTFDEVFPTSDGVQLQPSKTKRRQYVLCLLSPAQPAQQTIVVCSALQSCVACSLVLFGVRSAGTVCPTRRLSWRATRGSAAKGEQCP